MSFGCGIQMPPQREKKVPHFLLSFSVNAARYANGWFGDAAPQRSTVKLAAGLGRLRRQPNPKSGITGLFFQQALQQCCPIPAEIATLSVSPFIARTKKTA
jgi:hypothetical protein